MNTQRLLEVQAFLPNMVQYDLQSYSDLMLTDAGELIVMSVFRHPIIMRLGHDILELERSTGYPDHVKDSVWGINLPGNKAESVNERELVAYSITNLTAASGDAVVYIDNELKPDRAGVSGEEGLDRFTLYGSQSMVLGSHESATPGLQLSDSVGERHAQLRIGKMAGNLHFRDLYSQTGTSVYLHPEDARCVPAPVKSQVSMGGRPPEFKFKVEIDGHWHRPEA